MDGIPKRLTRRYVSAYGATAGEAPNASTIGGRAATRPRPAPRRWPARATSRRCPAGPRTACPRRRPAGPPPPWSRRRGRRRCRRACSAPGRRRRDRRAARCPGVRRSRSPTGGRGVRRRGRRKRGRRGGESRDRGCSPGAGRSSPPRGYQPCNPPHPLGCLHRSGRRTFFPAHPVDYVVAGQIADQQAVHDESTKLSTGRAQPVPACLHRQSTALSTGRFARRRAPSRECRTLRIDLGRMVGDEADGAAGDRDEGGATVSIAEIGGRTTRSSSAPHRTTSPPSSASSAACCCPRTPSPTSSRSSARTDFYRPAHQIIFDTILDLYGRGEPADAVTVAAELTEARRHRRGSAAPPYLHTLIADRARPRPTPATTPGSSHERAILRRLVEAGTRIVQIGYAADGARRRRGRRPRPGGGLRHHRASAPARTTPPSARSCRAPWTRSRRSAAAAARWSACPPASPTSTRLTNGLHPGQMIVIAARPGLGKALALDTPLPTPTAGRRWARSRSATTCSAPTAGRPGSSPRPRSCTAAPATRSSSPTATVIVADAEHQWRTDDPGRRGRSAGERPAAADLASPVPGGSADADGGSAASRPTPRRSPRSAANHAFTRSPRQPGHLARRAEPARRTCTGLPARAVAAAPRPADSRPQRRPSIRTTEEIAATAAVRRRPPNHAVEVTAPGCARLRRCPTCGSGWRRGESVVPARVDVAGCPTAGHQSQGVTRAFTARLCGDRSGLREHKHIPAAYLRASEAQRRALLAGLLDAGGDVAARPAASGSRRPTGGWPGRA